MEITDHIIVNMLKKQLLDIYGKYTAAPERLSSPNIRSAYNLLVKARTKDELRRWQQALVRLGLSFLDRNGTEIEDNVMGRLDDTVSRADDSAIEEFMLWKRSITPSAWHHALRCSCETVRMMEQAAFGSYNAHIVLFRSGELWAAVGADADRLFEIFGWQTGYVDDGEEYVSWMYVTKYGMKVLEDSKYKVEVLDIGKVDVVSDAFREDAVCAVQQYADYLREFAERSEIASKKLEKELPFIFANGDILEKSSITGFDIGKSRLTADISSGRKVILADDSSWRTDELGTALLLKLGSAIGEA